MVTYFRTIHASNNPILLHVDYKAGHGASADKFDAIRNNAKNGHLFWNIQDIKIKEVE
ncbi:MAG: hypothetical protein WAT21_01930 [Saprospiraceae bacterium]|nr:hypothetical protein [Candidatus Vicinibacter affinis]